MRATGARGDPRVMWDQRVPIEPVLALIVVAVVANLVVMAHRGRPRRSSGSATAQPSDGARRASRRPDQAAAVDRRDRRARPARRSRPGPTTASSGSSAGCSSSRRPRSSRSPACGPRPRLAIFVLLALAGLFVLVVHDLLPPEPLGPAKFVVEGIRGDHRRDAARALTGGVNSPFFFTFPLIVGGAALVVSPRDHVRRSRRSRASATSSRPWSSARRPVRAGDGRDGRHQPDGAGPARLRRDGRSPASSAARATRPSASRPSTR